MIFADVVWPALYLENRILTWWAIGIGLIIEFIFVSYLFKTSPAKAALMTLTANGASTIIGIILIPILGIVWELFPGIIIYKVFNIGTFNPITWTATFIIATLSNGAIETLSYKWIFKQRITKTVFWLICLANLFSVGIALATVFLYPPIL